MPIPESLISQIRIRENDPKIIQIQSWIDENSNSIEKNTIWRIGICNKEEIKKIEHRIRTERECKHFKYWAMLDFENGVKAITHLTKSKNIFKSPYHGYAKKGNYFFVYKIPCPYKTNFHLALRY